MTSVAEIDSRIYQLREELTELQQQRAHALALARAEKHQRETIMQVYAEFQDQREITVYRGRGWWHEHGELIRRATADELQAAEHLARAGAVERDAR